MEQKFQRGEIVLLDMEKWREEKERRCNGVYFRNNSLLSLKETKKKEQVAFLIQSMYGDGGRKNSRRNFQRPGTRMEPNKRPEKLQFESTVTSGAKGVIWMHRSRKKNQEETKEFYSSI